EGGSGEGRWSIGGWYRTKTKKRREERNRVKRRDENVYCESEGSGALAGTKTKSMWGAVVTGNVGVGGVKKRGGLGRRGQGEGEAGREPGRGLHRVADKGEKERFEVSSVFVHGLGVLVETKRAGALITMRAAQ
ncbi:hypothetical protein B1218_36750, partial [Pseudomonas ogarae]